MIEERREQLEARIAEFIRHREPHATTHDLVRWLVQEYAVLPRWREAHMASPKTHSREGMVTVWDHEGGYLGCMGINTWRALLNVGDSALARLSGANEHDQDNGK